LVIVEIVVLVIVEIVVRCRNCIKNNLNV